MLLLSSGCCCCHRSHRCPAASAHCCCCLFLPHEELLLAGCARCYSRQCPIAVIAPSPHRARPRSPFPPYEQPPISVIGTMVAFIVLAIVVIQWGLLGHPCPGWYHCCPLPHPAHVVITVPSSLSLLLPMANLPEVACKGGTGSSHPGPHCHVPIQPVDSR